MRLNLFSVVEVVIALFSVGALGVGAWAYASAPEPSDTIDPRLVEYTDDVFNFRLSYPADYGVHEYPEDEVGARTIAFEGPSVRRQRF